MLSDAVRSAASEQLNLVPLFEVKRWIVSKFEIFGGVTNEHFLPLTYWV